MAKLVRHRQTKEPETDRPSLKPPRHISTLHAISFIPQLVSSPEIASNRAGIDLEIRGERFVGRPSLRPKRLVDRLHPPDQWSRAVIAHRLDSSVADILAVVPRLHPRVQSFTQSWVDPDASYQQGKTGIVRE